MKTRISFVVVVIAVVVAFMAGWWGRGVVSGSPEAARQGSMAGAGGSSGGISAPSPLRERRQSSGGGEAVEESPEEAADPAGDRAGLDALLVRADRSFGIRLAEWTRAFGLTPVQQQAIRSAQAKLRQRIEASWTDGGLDPAVDPAEFGDAPLEAALKETLDAGQTAAFDSWQAAKKEQQTRSRATARLADLEALTLLSADQRDAVYAKFQETAFADGDGLPSVGQGAGPDAGFMKEVASHMTEPGSDFSKVAGSLVREKIDREVNGLTGILQPEQLDAYRLSLETRYAGWLIMPQ
ncbi:MAG: hypothetical protein QM755_23245 [Luteolibacter sp.]